MRRANLGVIVAFRFAVGEKLPFQLPEGQRWVARWLAEASRTSVDQAIVLLGMESVVHVLSLLRRGTVELEAVAIAAQLSPVAI